MNSGIALAMLLVAGHLIGDFFVQKTGVATRKKEFIVLLRHGAESYLTHIAVLWPFWSWQLLVGVAAVIALHLVVDSWKARARPGIANFLLDQGLHLLILAGCWVLLVGVLPADSTSETVLSVRYGWYAWGILSIGLVAFNLRGGSSLVRLALESTGSDLASAAGEMGHGETIGYLERILVMVSVLAGQWELVGLVMAAKSIARFKELDDKKFAEYYLVGTLMSILVAVVAGSVALWARGFCQ